MKPTCSEQANGAIQPSSMHMMTDNEIAGITIVAKCMKYCTTQNNWKPRDSFLLSVNKAGESMIDHKIGVRKDVQCMCAINVNQQRREDILLTSTIRKLYNSGISRLICQKSMDEFKIWQACPTKNRQSHIDLCNNKNKYELT